MPKASRTVFTIEAWSRTVGSAPRRTIGGHHDGRYAWAEQVELEAVHGIPVSLVRRIRRRGGDMVVEAAVLVVGDDEQQPVPDLAVRRQRLVHALDEALPAPQRLGGMLVLRPRPEVGRLEERVVRQLPALDVREESPERTEPAAEDIARADERSRLRYVARVDGPTHPCAAQRVEDRPDAVPPWDVVNEVVGLRSVREQPVGPGLRSEPS